jgi:acyl-CoA thioester hydrolase
VISAEVEIQIPFHDTDAMEVAWHGHYVKYFEVARCAALDTVAYNYAEMKASGYAWPVIDLHVRYAAPASFGQWVKVKATLVEWENRLKFEYAVTDAKSGQRLSKGETVQVAVDMKLKEMCYASPKVLFQKLGLAQP